MGLGVDCSGFEATGASEMASNNSGKLASYDKIKTGNNGNSVPESKLVEDGALEAVNSIPLEVTEASSPSSPSPGTSKGKGLRKWRRIRRDGGVDGGSNSDNSKLLKRGLPNYAANLNKPMNFSAEGKQTSEGSVSSSNAMLRNFSASGDHFGGIGGDSGLVIGPILADGTDSENSEDRSSKSTAASAPRMRNEIRERNRMKNLSGKNMANSVNKGHQGKARTDTSKKQRGEPVKIEKENSHSSLESDSRTSHSVSVQGNYSATSNGRQSGTPIIYGGETSDEVQGVERELSEEFQAVSSTKNLEFEVTSEEKFATDTSWPGKDEKSENNGSSSNLDPLLESIMLLQSVQLELGKEVEKFRDIGKDDLIQEELSDQLESTVVEGSFDVLGSDVIGIKEVVDSFRSKLDNATATLGVKETRIAELEGILGTRSREGERPPSVEVELERLFKQKIEAEVEYLVITRTVHNLRTAVVDQIKILEQQKSEQAQMFAKLEDAQQKAAMLKGQSEKLEKYCEEIASADENLKLRSSVSKYTSCLFLQLVLFVIVLAVFFRHLPLHDADFVPT